MGLFLLCFFISNPIHSQTVYVPTSHWVYAFLDRLEARGALERVLSNTRPMTRLDIADALRPLLADEGRLSRADRQQLEFLEVEFREELRPAVTLPATRLSRLIRHPWIDPWLPDQICANGRNFFTFEADPIRLYIDPIFVRGRLYASADTLAEQERWFTNSSGIQLWGTAGGHLGFSLDARDSQEWGTRHYGGIANFTQDGLGFVRSSGNQIDHDETSASLVYNWRYLTLQYGKDRNSWGPGYRGQMMISDRPTSYDEIKLQVRSRRFTFTSLWGLLQHYNPAFFEGGHQEKYIAAHRIEFSPWRFLDVGLQEMVIYEGRKFEPSYFNPLMFLRSAEHYLGDRDNAAMGLDVEFKALPKTKIYYELLLDDVVTSKLGSDYYANKYGWLAGLYHVDLVGIDNLDLRLEYARTRPFTYTHGGVTNFQQYSTNLGHRIGPNADEWYAGLKYQYSQPLWFEAFVAGRRHGANTADYNYGGSLYESWTYPPGYEEYAFLGGRLERQFTFCLTGSYELLRNVCLRLQYQHDRATTKWPGVPADYPGDRNQFLVRFSINE